MPFCVNCGHQLPDGAKFCAECGSPAQTSAQSQRKTVYDGEIHKCPSCGEVLKSFSPVCPACGHELRGVKNISSVGEFANELKRIEAGREIKRGKNIFAQAFSGANTTKTDEQKINLIRSFPIPNTKEDIFEFIILAASNIDLKLYGLGDQGVLTASQRAVSDAWLAKFEQAYEKARISFGGTSDFQGIQAIYEKKQKEIKRKKMQVPLLVMGSVAGCLLLLLLLWLIYLSL